MVVAVLISEDQVVSLSVFADKGISLSCIGLMYLTAVLCAWLESDGVFFANQPTSIPTIEKKSMKQE